MKKRITSMFLALLIAVSGLFITLPASAADSDLTYGDFSYKINGSEVTITKYNGSDSYVEVPDMIDGRYVTEIGSYAFTQTEKDYNEPNNIKIIGNCTLKKISLPNYLGRIMSYAFCDCTSLESIVLPNSLNWWSEGVFNGCTSLSEIVMGKNITKTSSTFGIYSSNVCSAIDVISLSEGFDTITNEKKISYSGWSDLSDVFIRSNVEFNEFYFEPCRQVSIHFHFPSKESCETALQSHLDYYHRNGDNGDCKYTFDFIPLSESHSKVTFDTNGGDTANSELWTLTGQMVSEEIPPAKKDCEFMGWYTNREGTGEPWDFTTDRVYSDMTLYAKWRPVQYSIKFNAQGGTCSEVSRDYSFGIALGSLPIPSKLNYQFIGWYTRPNAGGELYTENTLMPRSDITLYAGWLQEGKSIVVTFDPNGGTCDTQKALVGYNEAISGLPTPKLNGSKFLGWNTSPNGSGTYYTSATKVRTLDLTLYAIWNIQSYTLTFDPNGGTVKTASRKVKFDSRIGSLPTPKRDGYEFIGWYYSDGTRATKYDLMPARDTTLYAKWRGFEYMILFDARSGKCSTESKYVNCGDRVGTLPVPTRNGYQFMGWYTKTKCNGVKYTSTTIMPEMDITLYAGWKKVTEYATSVKLNVSKQTMGVGQKITLKATTDPVYTLDKFTWTSNNPNVAQVSKDGVVTAKSTGTATITVKTTKGKTASVKITVKKAVTNIKPSFTSRTLKVGQNAKASVKITGYAGKLTWGSSNPAVATGDSSGNICAKSKGSCTITIKAYNGVKATIKIKVS